MAEFFSYFQTVEGNLKLEPEKWIERYGDILFSYAFSRINRRDVAEDIVHDTFFSALSAKDSFRFDSSEKTWLIAILKDTAN